MEQDDREGAVRRAVDVRRRQALSRFHDCGTCELKEKPEWFADDEVSLKKGGTGHLPVKGHDIDLVRKALLREEAVARIREVKWWPPRLNRPDHHRLSKLRYEVSRNGVVRIEEIVFDHIDSKVSYAHLADGLFPEYDRRTTKLEPAQR